jgi:hypothetical protein
MSQILMIDDFKGGLTDNHISAPVDKYEKADNLVIVQHKDKGKLLSRPGSALFDSAHPQLPSGDQRVGKLRYFNDLLFAQSGRDIYYYSTSFNQLLGPVTSNKPFASGFATTNRISWDTYNNHLFIADDNFKWYSYTSHRRAPGTCFQSHCCFKWGRLNSEFHLPLYLYVHVYGKYPYF